MSTKPTLEQLLSDTTPRTTVAESARMLTYIETATAKATPISSPYFSYYFSFKPMSYVALLLVLLLGATGTVAASGAARPGDLLFPIDRATEEVRLALSSANQKEALQNQFIAERFTELREIVDEEKVATPTGSSTGGVTVRQDGESRVANAITVLATQLAGETNSTKRDQFLQDLLQEVSALRIEGRADTSLRLDTTRITIDDAKTEVETEDNRVKIEQKDGRVEIKYEDRGSNARESSGDSESHGTVDSPSDQEEPESEKQEDSSQGGHEEDESFRQLDSVSPTTAGESEHEGSKETSGHHGGGEDGRHGGGHENDKGGGSDD